MSPPSASPGNPGPPLKPSGRRAFQKSRRGCNACKARKVKCDEKHPVCGNCARRLSGIESCSYDVFISSSASQIHSKLTLRSPSTQIRSGTSSGSASRALELRLLQHYTLFTAQQMPSGGNKTWAQDLPRLGLQSEPVLDAILGISAQHLWALSPRDRSLAHSSRYYLNRALSQHRIALIHADRCSAESLLAVAILITHQAWTAAHSEKTDGSRYTLPLPTYYMARGIAALSDQLFPWLKESGYFWYVEQSLELPSALSSEDRCWADGKRDLEFLAAFLKQADVQERDSQVYRAALNELRSMHTAIKAGLSQSFLQRLVATMPIRLPIRFLELVEQHEPLALAILARNLALLKVIDTAWWLHGAGDHQVAEHSVRGICGLMLANWEWAMDWPLKVLSGEITIND
ncbi:MAG: hypothetical protein M1818_007822 [Claussenomyces sp. TS43310]|nr:MAG: hypothetical protein M1818_007822 [Claussenomyces sp. TS43310]